MNSNKISAVIPVRSGSVRCPNKNTRPFGDTSLLARKIHILKQVAGVDEIIVSSDGDDMLAIATDLGVKAERREAFYASAECPNYLYWQYLAEKVGSHPNLMVVNCVSPFVEAKTIEDIISTYRSQNSDGIVTVSKLKKFLWFLDEKGPINYQFDQTPNSQNLRPVGEITFAVSICDRQTIKNTMSLFGQNPILYELGKIEDIDIDHPHEFLIAELLYEDGLFNEQDAIKRMTIAPPQLLDCTIRDGGHLNHWQFTDSEVLECYKAVSEAGFDYCEVGFMRKHPAPHCGKWHSLSPQDLEPLRNYPGCKLAVMISVEDEDFDIPCSTETGVSLIRLHVRLEENIKLNRAADLARRYIGLGYEVCINLSSSDRYADEMIESAIRGFVDLPLKCLYLADTYGALTEEGVNRLFRAFKNANLPLGFHPHNATGNSLAKAKRALKHGIVMLDSTIYGLGRGGNLPSEVVRTCLLDGPVLPLLEFADKHMAKFDHYDKKKLLHLLAGAWDVHPDMASALVDVPMAEAVKTLGNQSRRKPH